MSKSLRQVPSVLVSTGNQSPLGAGNAVTDLAAGQFGVFDENGVSLAAGGVTEGEKFYLATKTSTGKIIRTKGFITKAHLRSWKVQCPVAATEQVVDITNICAECDSDYTVNVDINYPVAWHSYGFQPFRKSFSTPTSCCEADGTASCTELVRALRDAINNDTEGLLVSTARDPSDDSLLNDAALDAWDEVASGCPNLRIAVSTPAVAHFSGQPNLYTFPELLTIEASTQGFGCCSPAIAVADFTAPVIAQGDGVAIRMEEWQAGGVSGNQSPYRQTVSGIDDEADLNASASETYATLTIEYDDPSTNSFQEFSDPMIARIAIDPDAANATDNLGDILDDLLGTGTDIDTALTAC